MKQFFVLSLLFVFCCIQLSFFYVSPLAAQDMKVADLDGDGKITTADLKILTKDLNTLEAAHRGDINGDNYVDQRDVNEMARLLMISNGNGNAITQKSIDQFIDSVVSDSLVDTLNDPSNSSATSNLNDSNTGVDSQIFDNTNVSSSGGVTNTAGTGTSILGGSNTRPVANVEGMPPEFPMETRDYFKKMNSISSTQSMVRADCTLNIDSINQRRRSQGLTLGVSTVNDFLAKTEGNSLDTIPLSEPEDSTIYNSLGEGQMDSLDSRVADRRNAPGQLTTSSFATPSREFLPKSPQDMILDLINPENIQLLNTRQSSLEELKKEYTKVSPWDGAEDSSAVDGEVRENSDDPVVSQAINDMLSSGKFSEIADADRNSTVTRAELMKTLFNPQTARLAKNGNLEQVGINSSSTTGTEYEQIFDDIKDNLVRNGIITRQEVTQIERIFNPPPPPPPVATTTTPPVMVTDPVTGVTTIDPVNGGTTTGTTTASTGTGSSGSTSGSSVASATPAEVPWSIANPEAVANGTVIPVGYDGSGNSVPVPVTHNSDGTASWGSPTSSSSAPIDHSGEPGYRPGQ